jgi:hypothetical protein
MSLRFRLSTLSAAVALSVAAVSITTHAAPLSIAIGGSIT